MLGKPIDVADKPTLDEVRDLLKNSEYGLEVLKGLIEAGCNKPKMSIVLLDSSHKASWKSVSTLPYNFFYSRAAVIYHGEIHILGSYSGTTNHYKWDGTSWSEVSTLPYNFYYGSAVVYNDEIHILGGGESSTAHYKWDGSEWTSVSTLPYNFLHSEAIVYDSEIHILGGSESSTAHYKWDGSEWTSVSTLPYNFDNASAIIYNEEIHILGSSTVHYKWNGTSWTSVSTLPYNFQRGTAIIYNNEIHILGGGNIHILGGGTVSPCVSHYKWNGTSWTSISTLPYHFNYGYAVLYDNEIHILGGVGYSENHYVLYESAQFPDIYLSKDSKIYSSNKLIGIENCTSDTDHLVVTEDGSVSFDAKTSELSSIITIIN